MSKGFTLLELIIVIGIIAILGTVSVLVLNPAELFAQARDTTRISDLATVSNAINLYLTNVASPSLQGGSITCGTNFGSSVAGASRYAGAPATTLANAAVYTTGGSGWVSVNFGAMTGGSPLGTLPRDPTNITTYNYQYSCDNTNKLYELAAHMESAKYKNGGASDKETTDGGDESGAYEVGNSLTL